MSTDSGSDPDSGETSFVSSDVDMKELLGLYDLPAFARRGQDVEIAVRRLHERCQREREERLDLVRMRLRQWAAVSHGPDAALSVFQARIDHLWPLCGVEAPMPRATALLSIRKLKTTGRDLVLSIERFNRRWTLYLGGLGVDSLNKMIDQYNRYYLLEKECSLGSARLAARYFIPQPRVTPELLLEHYPLLPVPEWRS